MGEEGFGGGLDCSRIVNRLEESRGSRQNGPPLNQEALLSYSSSKEEDNDALPTLAINAADDDSNSSSFKIWFEDD